MIVNICGIEYTVEEKTVNFGGENFGFVSYPDNKITICSEMSEQMKNVGLIHEVLHAMFFHIGRMDLCDDETLIISLSHAMAQTFDIKRGEKDG